MRLPAITRTMIAGGLLGATLPLGLAPTAAIPAAAAASDYGGFGSSAWATPIRVEVYEPSIPVPAEPQLEAMFGYTKVLADSGTSQGKASYLWPGDPVGDGLPTFGAALGLPKELYENGYPVQVNSSYPSGKASTSDEPLPGMVMRTESGDMTARAETGFSPDGTVADRDHEPESSDVTESDAPSPADPGDTLGGLTKTRTTTSSAGSSTAPAAAEEPGVPGLPEDLAALVDVEGYVSTSRTDAVDGPVLATSRAAVSEVSLLEGIITVTGVEARARAVTDGRKGDPSGATRYGALSLSSQEFTLGPDGAIVGGQTIALPGMNATVAQSLARLGISFEIPEPVREVDGDKTVSVSEGLRIIIDTATLAPALRALPATQLAQLVPDDAAPLRSLVSGLGNLKPIIVITLGTATAGVDTVPAIDLPPLPGTDGTIPDSGGAAGGDEGGTANTGGAGNTGGSTTNGTKAPATEGTSAAAIEAAPTSATSGLPPLFSIPGMVVLLALVATATAGIWFRRLGILALGGGAACAHGLDTGLPDLRKA